MFSIIVLYCAIPVLQADALALPYRSASCDGVLCIAVLHHIASNARRARLLAELARLLRVGGRAIVSSLLCFFLPDSSYLHVLGSLGVNLAP